MRFSANTNAVCLCGGTKMNTLDRRQLVRGHVIDASVAKAAVHASRRERAEAAKKLRKAMAAQRFDTRQTDTISYPRQAAG
jgi:hypothetical protein